MEDRFELYAFTQDGLKLAPMTAFDSMDKALAELNKWNEEHVIRHAYINRISEGNKVTRYTVYLGYIKVEEE